MVFAVLAVVAITNKNTITMNNDNINPNDTSTSTSKNDDGLIEKPKTKNSPSPTPNINYNNFEETYKEYNLGDNNIRKKDSLIPGIEIWSVIRNLAEDPVQVDYWLVTNKSKNRMDPRLLTNSLKDIGFTPKSDDDALIVAKLAFNDGRNLVVEKENIETIKVNLPENVKGLLSTPKITKVNDHYTVDIDVYYFDQGTMRFFNIDNRSLTRYHFEIGAMYIKQIGADIVWMANPPTTI
jgi:hypothetical protein